MATSTIAPLSEPSTRRAPPAALNLSLALASMWFFGGLLLDGWAHSHLDLSKEGFFTPYHAVFYSGFAAVVAVLGIGAWRNRSATHPWYRWFPAGYEGMAAGICIFAAGGFLDMLWHLTFGIEQDTQALFSPTHLLLAFGGAVMMCGAIRAGLLLETEATWRARFFTLLPLALLGTLVSFFCMWAFDTDAVRSASPHVLYPSLTGKTLADVNDLQLQNGITAVILRSLVMVGIAGWAARRLTLPFGAIAFLVFVPNVLIAAMLDPNLSHLALPAISSLVAGFVGDLAVLRWGPFERPSWRSRTFAFGLPFVFWAVSFSLTFVVFGGFWWTPHAAYGAPVIGGLMGLLLALSGEARSA